MKYVGFVFSILLCAYPAMAQDQHAPVNVPLVAGKGFGGENAPYTHRPADLTLLPWAAGARHGKVWLQNTGEALLIVGEVDGAAPDIPRDEKSLAEKDHVEIWLADVKEPELPPVGWGNQFDQVTLPKGADSCADWMKQEGKGTEGTEAEKRCRTWAETQAAYRTYFHRLFVRHWLAAPDQAVETFATPAFDEIAHHFASDQRKIEEVPTLLKPMDRLRTWFGVDKNHPGYSFQVLIPFAAFPPLSTTQVRELRLLVDVFTPGSGQSAKNGGHSSTAPPHPDSELPTFNALRFDPPLGFHLTPCEMPLAAKDVYGDMHAAWFVPSASGDYESDAFILVNDGAGYQYEPDALSPVARPVHFFWHGVGENEWVCGPHLTYRGKDQSHAFDAEVDEDGFDAHRLRSGDLLVKVGPRVYYSAFGSGACGACPRTEVRILRLRPDMRTSEALRLGVTVDTGTEAAQDFSMSPDWLQVIQYDQAPADDQGKPGAWSSTAWCRGEMEYQQCGHKDGVEPPDPPVLKDLRGPE